MNDSLGARKKDFIGLHYLHNIKLLDQIDISKKTVTR